MNAGETVLALASDVAGTASAEALDRARLCLLDWLGCTIAGAREPLVEVLVADAEAVPPGVGQRLIGRAEQPGLRDAVLINGAAGHALDYDDGMPAMLGHPSVAIVPALFCLAAQRQIGGEALLRAIIAGAEVAGRIGLMMAPDHYDRGFHCTGTIGALAAAAGCAHLIGLDPVASRHALGLAGTRAAGLKASFGTDGKPLHAGWAALVGLTAARWAERGMTGAEDILAHGQGFGPAQSASFLAARGLEPGGPAYITTVTHKAHAACAVTHPAIDAMLALRHAHRLDAARIARVVITVAPQANDICNIAEPASGLHLKFSLRAVVAMALLGIDTASPDSYSAQTAGRGDMRALIGRSEVTFDPAYVVGQTSLRLDMVDGSVLHRAGAFDFEGDTDTLRVTLGAKFVSLASPVIGHPAAQAVCDTILSRDHAPDPVALLRLTCPA